MQEKIRFYGNKYKTTLNKYDQSNQSVANKTAIIPQNI